MSRGLNLLTSLGLGAGLMYFLDPDRGNARRARVRDQAQRWLNESVDGLDKATRDLNNRTTGLVSDLRTLLLRERVADDVLEARIRSRLGRAVSHPGSIETTVQDGILTLSGPILTDDVPRLMAALAMVPGLGGIRDELSVHEEAGNVPGLQGVVERTERDVLAVEDWPSGLRLLLGASGGVLALYGLGRRSFTGNLLGLAGFGVLTRAIVPAVGTQVLGERGIVLQKTLNLDVPIERVFALWSHPENFPRFMEHVQEVSASGEGRHHWVVQGPAGLPVEWDSTIRDLIPNRLLTWASVPGSAVENAGSVHFQSNPDGGTRVHVRITYRPPAGVLGHAVASLLGSNPKQEMDVDLNELKGLLERAPRAE